MYSSEELEAISVNLQKNEVGYPKEISFYKIVFLNTYTLANVFVYDMEDGRIIQIYWNKYSKSKLN
jgi:hypothetical protein